MQGCNKQAEKSNEEAHKSTTTPIVMLIIAHSIANCLILSFHGVIHPATCTLKVLCLALCMHLVNDHVKDFNSAIVVTWMWSKQIMQALWHKSYDDAVSMPIKGSAKIRRISCMTYILGSYWVTIGHTMYVVLYTCKVATYFAHLNRLQLTGSIDGQL